MRLPVKRSTGDATTRTPTTTTGDSRDRMRPAYQVALTVGRLVGASDAPAEFPNADGLGTTHCEMASIHTDGRTASV